jgi:hypothetical protein
MSARIPSRRPPTWVAYRVRGAKAAWLGHVEAPTMEAAITAAAAEFHVPPGRILVQRIEYA